MATHDPEAALALGPVLVAWYYDLVGNYDFALLAMACCTLGSAVMLYRMRDRLPRPGTAPSGLSQDK